MNLLHVKTNTVADFTGTVTVYNQTGGSQTIAATDLVRPSDWNSQHKMLLTFAGNTTGSSTISGTAIPIAGAGGVTVGGSNGSFVISGMTDPGWITTAAQSNHSHGNPTLALTNLNGTTNSASNGFTLSLSAVAQSVQPVAASAANGSFAFSTLPFVNTNGVSWSTSTDGIRATVKTDYLTTARASNDAVGLNTALTAGPLAWTVNSGGISLNAGSAAGTTSGFGGNLISGSMTHNTAGLNLSLNHPAWLTTAANSTHSHDMATTTTNGSLVVVATENSNGYTLGVPPFITTAAASDHSHGNPTLALTNLTGTTASNSAGFTLSLSGAGGGVINQTGPNIAAGTRTATSGTVVFSNANNISFGLDTNDSVVTASFNPINIGMSTNGNTAGTTGTFDGANLQYILIGGDNITLSQSSNGSSVSLSIVGPSPGAGGGATISSWANLPSYVASALQNMRGAPRSAYIVPLQIDQNLTAAYLQFLVSNSIASSSFASTANTTFSFLEDDIYWLALYSKGTGLSTDYLMSITSTSISHRFQVSAFYGSATNTQQGYSASITWYNSAGSTSYSTQYTTSNLSTLALSTAVLSNFTGNKFLQIPWATSFTPGQYYLAYHHSSTSSTQGTNLSGIRMQSSTFIHSQVNQVMHGSFGQVSNTRQKFMPFLGSASTANSTTFTRIPSSVVSTAASHPIPYISFMVDMPAAT